MIKILSFVSYCAFLGFLLISYTTSTQAQLTIFNIPSTDVTKEKSIYFEGDFIGHLDSYRNGGFQSYGYRTVYGATKNFEVGFNLLNTRNGSSSPSEFQPNLKFKIYENERFGISATTGVLVTTPLNRAAGNRTIGLFYSNVSKNLKHSNGTRVTGGIYTVVGAARNFGTTDGVILGIEQPIKGKLSFLADWYSGKNRYGYSTAGLTYAISKRQFLLLGYNFGNSGRGNNAISAFYGYTF